MLGNLSEKINSEDNEFCTISFTTPPPQIYTGCPTKNYTLFWRAVAPLNFELGIKVGGVLESSGSQLFKTVPTFDSGPSKS